MLREERILVVDDNEGNRFVLTRHLKKMGFEHVDAVDNGAAALAMLSDRLYDLVLLDIVMPVMDGKETLKQMKINMKLRDIPVIIISSMDDRKTIAECIELGAVDHLFKPFDKTLIQARINASLEMKRLNDEKIAVLEHLKAERNRSSALLNVIMPSFVAGELKATGKVEPRVYEDVAILFCDIIGFSDYCKRHSPKEVIGNLQILFEKYEDLMAIHSMEKIKTIGDGFMGAAGLFVPNSTPLPSAIKCGLDMCRITRELDLGWDVRVGVHIGPVVAGVVGHQKYQFDVWGDIVNIASRVTDLGKPGTVSVTHDSWLHIRDECRGNSLGRLDIKGIGKFEIIECVGFLDS